jgi:phage baseplate assembly protein W
MANRLYNQQTVAVNKASVGDQNSGSFTYKGFRSSDSAQNFKAYDADLVKQDILNHFYIKKGEKLQNPDFGTIIWDLLFEPMTEEVKELITKDVEEIINYDPRVTVNAVTIDSTDQGIRIEVDLTYMPFNINERMTLSFDKSNFNVGE